MKEIKNIIKNISDLIVTYNKELKIGNWKVVQLEVDKIIKVNESKIEKHITIFKSPDIGLHFEFIGIMSYFLFPYILYANNFRIQILKNLNSFIQNVFTIEEFGFFLSKEISSTLGVKKGGFYEKTLESIRFYFINYPKVLDNSIEKYLPLVDTYKPKYVELTQKKLKARFPLIQTNVNTYLIPNCNFFNLSGIIIDYDNYINNQESLQGNPLGMLYGNKKEKKFLLFFTDLKQSKVMKNLLIRKISFFENLDLFYKHEQYFKLRNEVKDIIILYDNYKEETFTNTSVEYNIDFQYKKNQHQEYNFELEPLIHIFNRKKLPLDFELHPVLHAAFSYRNKLVTFYSSIKYFIHIYEPRGKPLDYYWQLLDVLFKNTFSNGYIIHYKSGMLLSTNAFREDFEKVKREFIEFVWSFKLECEIYEGLIYIPFSFYYLPNSQYYSNATNEWEFPVFEDKPVTAYFDYLAVNYNQELKRLEDASFKASIDQTLERLTSEITEIKKQQEKKQQSEDQQRTQSIKYNIH